MCGIVGHVVREGVPDTDAVKSGMAAMLHRGPDGEGVVQMPLACLGHRRLSIIDVAGSPQPWQSSNGRYTLVFNGEIYNYLELRSMLEKEGYRFQSRGDTEVLLAMFIHEGTGCLNKLNGMFAFAVWDQVERKLLLARDRLGKKPLYYATIGSSLAFASEIGGLRGFMGIDTTIDLHAAHDYFAHQFIGRDRSIYRGIKKLQAGNYLEYADGRIIRSRYWSPPLPGPSPEKLQNSCEELKMLVDDAVRLRLRSDVPVGCFLSGGLDSSVVVSSIRRHGADVQSFTVGFRDASFDESIQAGKAAQFFSTHHRNRIVEMDVLATLDKTINAFGEPFADPSALPMDYLCQHAREHVTVALSGDGVDELFGGYRRYFARRLMQLTEIIPRRLRLSFFMNAFSWLPENETYFGYSRLKQMKLFSRLMQALDESPRDPLAQVFTLSECRALFAESDITINGFDYLSEPMLENVDPVSRMMLADVHNYLVDDILVKVDRMSMKHSLEVRSPFLDYRIVEFACRLPLEYKIRGSVQKYLVRECYRDLLPGDIIKRRKHGFAVPLAGWFRGILKPVFESTVFDTADPGFLNKKMIQQIWNEHQSGHFDHGFKLWCLLVFFHWYCHTVH
ncbi:MAG: asparagine synthase, glutamine-hydrolyzing [Gammaproteobacteria bacterium]|nr:asparagine synthase, glutamine-hydrolyzing [Gammaproteobacteria bacterium]